MCAMTCPTCGDRNATHTDTGGGHRKRIVCPKCGTYEITDSAISATGDRVFSEEETSWIPYNLRLMQQHGSIPTLHSYDFCILRKNLIRPTPSEVGDNLIKHLGQDRRLGHFTNIGDDTSLPHIIGVPDAQGVRYIADELEKKGWINIDRKSNASANPVNLRVNLTFSGWERFNALARGAHSGSYAFMALQFGNIELNKIVDNCFKPSARETGFELRLLNDHERQRAGLIDDRLRGDVRGARFLIVDLTDENNGAYWEAGYGEGLGKPVIYTCKKAVFEKRSKDGGGTHFDTNHHLHILWDESMLDRVADELKACIRATIPEAKRNR